MCVDINTRATMVQNEIHWFYEQVYESERRKLVDLSDRLLSTFIDPSELDKIVIELSQIKRNHIAKTTGIRTSLSNFMDKLDNE